MKAQQLEIGMIGLGVMGRNLLLNMAYHGHSVAGYDKDAAKVAALRQEAENRDIRDAADIKEFIALLRKPRAVMMLVPAGPPVDSVINDLLAHIQPGDLIIDAGNSYFKDTDVRLRNLAAKGIQFLGVGVSGGEEGARHGSSIMPGGPKEAYERVRSMLEAVAARVSGDPCVTYLGPGSAGHFVKMVHNGIEYGVMQLLAEAYDLMKRSLSMNDDEMGETYALWNKGELNGYLVEITGHIFSRQDEKTGKRLLDEILDVAEQKGTGMWTSQSAMELQVPIPTIDLAVAMRDLSVFEKQRETAGEIFNRPSAQFAGLPIVWGAKIELLPLSASSATDHDSDAPGSQSDTWHRHREGRDQPHRSCGCSHNSLIVNRLKKTRGRSWDKGQRLLIFRG